MKTNFSRLKKIIIENQKPLFVIAIVWPVFHVLLFPFIYHRYDVPEFGRWVEYLETNTLRQIYSTDCVCNYPFFGLLSSMGVMYLFNKSILLFKFFLAVFEVLSIIFFRKILVINKIQDNFLYAAIFGLALSTWVGGAFWGQIDSVALLVLLSVILILERLRRGQKVTYLKTALLGVLFLIFFSLKQLSLFNLIPFLVILLVYYRSILKSKIFSHIGLFLLVFLGISFFIDSWLSLPEGVVSHLEKVYLEGSDHISEISGNGFNIWVLIGFDHHADSSIPFYSKLSPLTVGLGFFFIGSLVFTIQFFISTFLLKKEVFTCALIYLVLINLLFNLVLTGTHERYLYYLYPFLIILMALDEYLRKKLLVLTCFGAVVYGLFVLSVLVKYPLGHFFIGYFHLFLFTYLIYLSFFRGKQIQ